MSVLQGLCAAPGAFNKQLVAAWKGEPNDDRLFYSMFNGTKWTPAATIPGTTSTGPSLATDGAAVYAAWKGEWSDPRLFFSKFNGSTWEAQAQIPNVYSEFGPALGLAGTELVAAWKNAFDQRICYSVYNGHSWSAQSIIPGVGSSTGPSLAAVGNTLYAAWKGESSENLYYASYAGGSWSAQTQIPGVGSSVGPSLGVVGTKLYAVWKGETTENLYYAYFDGAHWSAQTQIPGVASSIGAAVAGYNGKLYAMWKGSGADVSLWDAHFDGNSWSAQANNIPGNTGPDPSVLLPASPGDNSNYVMADSKGVPLTGATVTVIVAEDIVPQSGKAYSVQINCNSPAQRSGAEPVVWQQFGFRMARNTLFAWVNGFRQQDLPADQYLSWDSRSMPNNSGVVSLPDNRLPAGWQLTTTLITDHNNVVTGLTFSVVQPNGTVLNSPVQELVNMHPGAVYGNLAPILDFQVVLIAENVSDDGTTDSLNFSAGQGIFLCYATNNLTASASQPESAEQSNMNYSSLPASYLNGEFYQLFGLKLS